MSTTDHLVAANTPAYGAATVIDTKGKKGMTIEQALPKSGLDFTVSKVPIFGPNGQEIERRFGVMRDDTEEILGVVGKTWQPVQNLEGFAIINDVIAAASAADEGYKLWIEMAGDLDGGRKVWILVHIEDDWQIAGEQMRSYLLFANGHDGRTSVTVASTDFRVRCANFLNYAMYREGKEEGDQRVVRVRHTAKAGERIKEAHAILGMRNRRKEELARQGEWLVEQTMSDGDFMAFLDKLMPCEQEQGTPAATMNADRRAAVAKVYLEAPNLEQIRGTSWGALQAVIEYDQYRKEYKTEETQLKNQWGLGPAGLPQRAYQLLAPAAI